MVTPGNLELRMEGEVHYASTKSDGKNVFRIIESLSRFLDMVPNPTPAEYRQWFVPHSMTLLGITKSGGLKSGNSLREVIIDSDRRLLLMNAKTEDKPFYDFGAITNLRDNHGYQILHF